MGMFTIYSFLEGYELYDLIDFKNPKILWEPYEDKPWVDHQVVKYDVYALHNIWDYLVCIEHLPNLYRVYYGDQFRDYIEFNTSEELYSWLSSQKYSVVKNFILKECFSCIEYAVEGVERFCKVVAHNKAEQYFLEGHTEYE